MSKMISDNKTPEADNQRNETRPICPNCDQWQHDNLNGYLDCFHECAKLGFAPRVASNLSTVAPNTVNH